MNNILLAGLRLYMKYFTVILGLVLTIGLPCQLLSNYVAYEVFGRDKFIPAWQTGALIELVFGSVIAGGILQALFADSTGRRAGYLECLSVGISNWVQLCWTNLLMSCLILMASVLFFLPVGNWQMRLILLLPALILGLRFSLAVVVVMMEDEWGAAALRRSVRLTADRMWQILGLCILVYVPVNLAGFVGIGMLQTNPQLDTWQIIAAFGTLLKLISCFIPVCFFCLYERIISEDKQED
ncbi:MAG TPA: hypothetical protein VF585_09365 [Chthoniobacterales bacterium]|jgi:hypothetical protein